MRPATDQPKTKILYSRNGRTWRAMKHRSQFGHLIGAEAVVKPTQVGWVF
jgi:hypothetical protein